jgi:L-alanine-DL-glutamate epimerase-like enolase superfamily enzyme
MTESPNSTDKDLRIKDVKAYPTSYPIPPGESVTLGIGRAVKRDAVVVKVTTEGGLIGYGESHHGRAHIAIAQLVNTTLRQLILGMSAADTVGCWNRIYSRQLASHGMGAACAMAMSGIDMALWDIRGKAAGWPLYKLLGGAQKPIPGLPALRSADAIASQASATASASRPRTSSASFSSTSTPAAAGAYV